jgi:hypothetical protein
MKKNSPSNSYSLFCQFLKKFKFSSLMLLLAVITLALTERCYAQQVLGSFPVMDGGFESQSGTLATLTTPVASSQTAYTRNNINVNGTINTTGGRSSAKYLSVTTGSTGQGFYTPTATLAQNTSYVVQYYFKYTGSSNRNFTLSGTDNGGTNWGSGISASGVNGITNWTKRTDVINSNNHSATSYGLIKANSAGGGISTAFDIDDYVIYAAAAPDVTAPNDVTSPSATYISSSTLNINWTSPASGVDGGGYVIVRYTTDPATEPVPNANGIYLKGNSIGNGTVAYIGTGTSFSDAGLNANTLYYYRAYSVDKAFNYSIAPTVFTGMTTAVATPAVSITIPGIPAASIERSSVTDIIYSFSLTATTYYTTLTQLTFQNTSGTYSSVDFSNFKLYASATNSFPGGTPLATISNPANISPQTFTGFSKIIPASAIYFWITTDVKAAATYGNSITVTPDINGGNLSFSGTPPTVTVASVTPSGAQTIVAPVQYTWIGGATGSWAVPGNWTPTRNTIKASDDIIFNTAGTVTVTNVPATETVSSLLVSTNGNVTLTSAVTSTLTILNISGLGFADLSINAGSALTLATSVNLTLGTGTGADISGVLNVNSGSTYNTNAANASTTLTNATYPLAVNGIINNAGTVTSTTAARLVINNGAVYNHKVDGGVIPTATWNFNSTCLISGIVDQQSFSTGPAQTFSKFIWDCPGQNKTHFILGQNTSNASPCSITDSFIVKRTAGKILQITSSGGQKDFTCGNYIQYGGIAAITYNTDAGGLQRSLTVNNTFYVVDSLASDTKFQIINNPGNSTNITGRLYVKGNVEMHDVLSSSTLEDKKDNLSNPSIAEIWFTGNADQYARFSSISDSINFVVAQTSAGNNVILRSDAKARQMRLAQGTFSIASNTLTIDREVSYPSPGLGLLGGSVSSNLTMTQNGGDAGTLNFSPYSAVVKNLTQLTNNTVSLGTTLSIAAGTASSPGRDSLGISAQLNTNDYLVLASDINGTARIAELPVDILGVSQAKFVGKVTVERALPMNLTSDSRRWRLLTAPFKADNAPTINTAWQEGVSNPDRTKPSAYDPKPGYGTHITKSTSWNGSDGYDQGSTNNPSIYYYSNGTDTWTAPDNTSGTKITDNSGCYMLFARGDRSILVSTPTINANPTILEPKGELNTGNVSIDMVSSGLQSVGNPYASQIKLDNVLFNGIPGKSSTVYLWDPRALGSSNVGSFITCSGNGNGTYTYTGNVSSYGNNPGAIESSDAFMVQGTGGQIVFHESDKTKTSSTIGIASRPAQNINSFGKISTLYTDMLVMKDGSHVLADGVAVLYNTNYENSIDHFDARKLVTFTSKERLSIRTEGQFLAIERRKKLENSDTIFLNISKLGQKEYQFSFRPLDFEEGYSALLIDQFSSTATAFNLEQASIYPFNITADPASSATGRFYIIFRKKENHENEMTLSAHVRDRDIALEWNIDATDETKASFIERATDGKNFVTVAKRQDASGTSRNSTDWLDINPVAGKYSYRIRYTNAKGKIEFSNVAEVEKQTSSNPSVSPNPVSNGRIGLQMGNLAEGSYRLKLINNFGLVVYTGNVFHKSGDQTKTIDVQNNPRGIYKLEITSAFHKITTISVLIQ